MFLLILEPIDDASLRIHVVLFQLEIGSRRFLECFDELFFHHRKLQARILIGTEREAQDVIVSLA